MRRILVPVCLLVSAMAPIARGYAADLTVRGVALGETLASAMPKLASGFVQATAMPPFLDGGYAVLTRQDGLERVVVESIGDRVALLVHDQQFPAARIPSAATVYAELAARFGTPDPAPRVAGDMRLAWSFGPGNARLPQAACAGFRQYGVRLSEPDATTVPSAMNAATPVARGFVPGCAVSVSVTAWPDPADPARVASLRTVLYSQEVMRAHTVGIGR